MATSTTSDTIGAWNNPNAGRNDSKMNSKVEEHPARVRFDDQTVLSVTTTIVATGLTPCVAGRRGELLTRRVTRERCARAA